MPWTTRTPSSHTTTTHQWRTKTRPAVLARDRHTCQIRGPHCTTTATQVDHITPIAAGGHPHDLDNLRAVCEACHAAKTTTDAATGRARLSERRPPAPHPGLTT